MIMRLKKTKNLRPALLTLGGLLSTLLFFVFSNGSIAGDRVTIPIEGSSSGPPAGWELKEWKGAAKFDVVDTEAGKTIHLRSSSTSSALYREIKFDIREYPYISWRWKVVTIPQGADVRKKSTDDQAAQVYVIFPKFPALVNSKLVGYIWDTGAPAGSIVTSTKTSNTRYIVIKSGKTGLGEWFTEKRNVYEDYRKLFGEEPPMVGRVSVMIDSDDTKSAAESYIGDIYFSKE
jgi:hypothetical protein